MSDEAPFEGTPSSEPSLDQPEPKRGPGRPAKNDQRVAELEQQLAEMRAETQKMQELVQTLAESVPQRDPEPAEFIQELVPWGEDGRFTYSCESREHTIIMRSGQKVVMGTDVVVIPQRIIEFQEHHYVTEDPEIRDFIESLSEFKSGKPYQIARGAELRAKPVAITDGPRTATREVVKLRETPRPAGALSAPL